MLRKSLLISSLLVSSAMMASAQEAASFLAGCWQGARNGERIEEWWSTPGGGVVLGMARTVRPGRPAFTEFVMVREEEGVLTMRVQLRLAEKSTPFRLTKSTPRELIFENPEHDFPKRIIYRLTADDTLEARVDDGGAKGQDFVYKRGSCR